MKLVVIASIISLFTFSAEAGTFVEDFDNNFGVWQEFLMGKAVPGSWKIVKGELHAVSPDGWTRLLTVGDETWRDYIIEFDVKPLEKPGHGNIAIAARISGDWAVWCMIGDHPSPKNISVAFCAAGNFRDPSPLFFFGREFHRPLELKKWSKLKLSVEGNILNFWINGKHALGPVQLPNHQTFRQRDENRRRHNEKDHAGEDLPELRPMRLDGFQDFLTGAAGLGLANQTARFDNVVITGNSIPINDGLSVTPKAKLATVWGSLKRF